MSTVYNQVLVKIAAICELNAGADGVYRSRESALARSEGTAVVVRPAEAEGQNIANGLRQRDFGVDVEILTRGQIPEDDADPIMLAAHAAIMADPTLGGLVAKVIEGPTKWDFELADMNACSVMIRYTVRFLTPTNSLSATV